VPALRSPRDRERNADCDLGVARAHGTAEDRESSACSIPFPNDDPAVPSTRDPTRSPARSGIQTRERRRCMLHSTRVVRSWIPVKWCHVGIDGGCRPSTPKSGRVQRGVPSNGRAGPPPDGSNARGVTAASTRPPCRAGTLANQQPPRVRGPIAPPGLKPAAGGMPSGNESPAVRLAPVGS
jgi:hypothetical protein